MVSPYWGITLGLSGGYLRNILGVSRGYPGEFRGGVSRGDPLPLVCNPQVDTARIVDASPPPYPPDPLGRSSTGSPEGTLGDPSGVMNWGDSPPGIFHW